MKTLITVISIALLASFYNPCSAQTSPITATVEQREGFYLFFPGQKPIQPYEYVASVKSPGMVKSYRMSDMINTMLKAVKKENVSGDALIFTEADLWKVDVIRFKK